VEHLRKRKQTLKELMNENKKEIERNIKTLERIETKIDNKHWEKLNSNDG
jgi:hypothetical protein